MTKINEMLQKIEVYIFEITRFKYGVLSYQTYQERK